MWRHQRAPSSETVGRRRDDRWCARGRGGARSPSRVGGASLAVLPRGRWPRQRLRASQSSAPVLLRLRDFGHVTGLWSHVRGVPLEMFRCRSEAAAHRSTQFYTRFCSICLRSWCLMKGGCYQPRCPAWGALVVLARLPSRSPPVLLTPYDILRDIAQAPDSCNCLHSTAKHLETHLECVVLVLSFSHSYLYEKLGAPC